MEELDFRADAERVQLPVLIQILNPQASRVWDVGGARITATQVANRNGVPRNCSSYRYIIHYEPGNWTVVVRSVRTTDDLHRPLKTHTVVEEYRDDDGIHGGRWEVQKYFLAWIKEIPGL